MDQRTENVLESIIVHYIKTAKPIGSRALSKIIKEDISAATIRNVMSDLSDLGLIEQPHTSAGRIPSDQAYRYYINKLLKERKSKHRILYSPIANIINNHPSRLEDILLETTKELSSITNCTGIVISPKPSASRLKNIQLLRLSDKQLLVILVTLVGMVHNKIVHLDSCPNQESLNKIADILLKLFEEKTFTRINKLLRNLPDENHEKAINIGKIAFDIDSLGELHILGRSKMCLFPEFNDKSRLQKLYRMFEEKTALTNTLHGVMNHDEIQIKIGTENRYTELNKCSVIAGTYGSRDGLLGSIGIIGPTRMNYPKIISAINYSTQKLTFSLGQFIDNS